MSDANVTRNAHTAGTTAPKVEVMRSYLSRARGMGAAGSGIHHWRVERLTAIALVPLTIWFIYAVLHLLGAPQFAVHRFVANPVNTVLLLAMVTMTFHHMQLGLQVVMEDYIDSQKWQAVAILLNKAVALILGLLCAVSILRMAFTA
jgi:succinate dehydrogenase / fumarate reductase membrane anchor subunit